MYEVLINAVHERPVLWDKRNKRYHNRCLSFREWEEVAKVIGTTSEAAKKKWKNARDTFAKELKKIPKFRSGADADNEPEYKGTWPHFESMYFLKNILKPRKTDGNVQLEFEGVNPTDVLEFSYASPDEEFDVNMSESATVTRETTIHEIEVEWSEPGTPLHSPEMEVRRQNSVIPSASTSPTVVMRKKRKKDDDLEAFLELEREKIKVLRQDQESNNDEDLLWFESLLPYMKQLPSVNRLQFRMRMQELLLKELSSLSTPQPDSQ